MRYLDYVSHSWLLQMTMPLTFRLLKLLPITKLQLFLEAGDRFYEVCLRHNSASLILISLNSTCILPARLSLHPLLPFIP